MDARQRIDADHRASALERARERMAGFDEIAARTPIRGQLELVDETKTLPMTDREVEVLNLIARGLANKHVAARLVISEETVKSHVRHILGKLHAENRAHAVGIAYRSGVLPV